ncbi:MAG: hypothetical protein KME27_02635 [Lyngbya sp. HA4199-MV5]|jgi:uncharacterized membrane-anchored protein|nr:hypothetical protein [Lyngbya sp. HA4199-MV5]
MMGRSLKPSMVAFLAVLAMTVLVWVLRGIGLLTFIPGSVIWVLILLSLLTAILMVVR